MPNIKNYKDIDVENILFSKGEYSGGFKNIKISYKPDKSDLIIQAPKMTIPFGIYSYDEKNNST